MSFTHPQDLDRRLFAAELDDDEMAALAGGGLAALSGEDHQAAAGVEEVEAVAVMEMG